MDLEFQNQYLTYDMVAELKNPRRFWHQIINNQIYLFDQSSGNIYAIKGNLSVLFNSQNRDEFSVKLAEISWDEIKSIYTNVQMILCNTRELALPVYQVNFMHFNLNTFCNLNCTYCFKASDNHKPIDWSIIVKSIEYMVYECGKEANEYYVGFGYTGEPLLDFENMKKMARYLSSLEATINKRIQFHFLTNGTVLTNAMITFFTETGIKERFNISIDGSQPVHDQNRRFSNGQGSFSLIEQNIRRLKQQSFRINANSVLTKNYPFPKQILTDLLELGCDTVLIKPIRKGSEISFDEHNIEKLKNGYQQYFQMVLNDILRNNIERLKKYVNDFALRYLKRILLKQWFNRRCSWGLNSITVNHIGEFYPCDSAMNFEKFKIGDAHQGIDWAKYRMDLGVDQRRPCSSCWGRNICGGTCYLAFGNDLLQIDPVECALNMFWLQNSLRLIFILINQGFDLDLLRRFLLEHTDLNQA